MATTLELQDRFFVIADESMERTIDSAARAARTGAPVLICGESGTGKELIARFIHEKSQRQKGPFLSINCAAIPEGLIEAELFGYEKGAFTGAIQQRIGKFERASHGTFLLDEVSEMPIHLQAKLLRVLQEGEIDRIGGAGSVRVQTRIIATTNREPLDLIRRSVFRQDLFYRLNVLRVDCPPLRGRKSAIKRLAGEFVRRSPYRELFPKEPVITDETMRKLMDYSWPGNVRELQNVIERAIINSDGGPLGPELFQLAGSYDAAMPGPVDSLSSLEQSHIEGMLEKAAGNRTEAARRLGISVRTLRNKLKIYGAA
jgi:transcriptional regulator with PAS, ATPase and Fis domain